MRIKKICGERKKKIEREEPSGTEVSTERQKNTWAIPNYEPKPVEGEDATTLSKHEQILQVGIVRLFDNIK